MSKGYNSTYKIIYLYTCTLYFVNKKYKYVFISIAPD